MSDPEVDVAIVGGGVVGCASAMALAPDLDVLVLEADQIAGGATALAAGEVTMSPSYTDHPTVAEHANEFFRAFDGTGAFEYDERPSLELVPPEGEQAARRRVDRLAAEDVRVAFLEPETVEETYPRFDLADYVGAVRHEETGFVDPYTLAMTYKSVAEERGARIETGRRVTDLIVDGDVKGVETERGSVRAETVVVAAGWRTEPFLRDYLALPVRPYRTQIVVLESSSPFGDTFPMGWIPGAGVYFKPELNGDILVGGWSAAEADPVGASDQADEAFKLHVADLMPTVIDSLDRAKFVDGWAGIDGATPDTRPIVDAPAAGPDGLVVATGFHGRGVMTSPVAATLVRSFVTGETTQLPTEPFELSRFDSKGTDFPFISISSGDEDYD